MVWGAIGAAAVGAVAGGVQASKNRKAAAKLASDQAALGTGAEAAGLSTQQDKDNQIWASDRNKESQLWANDINQQNIAEQMGQNRIGQTNGMGSSVSYDPTTGAQTTTLADQDQANLDALRGKTGDIMGGMGGGFDVNGDVMNAYRAQQQPGLEQARNKENARLAAMGLGTGSGSAWGQSQDALNRSQNDADQKAILAGFQADQSLRESNRADLGSMNQVRSGIQSGTQMPDFWKAGTTSIAPPQFSSPSNSVMAGWGADQSMLQNNSNASQAASANNTANWAGMLGQGVQSGAKYGNEQGWWGPQKNGNSAEGWYGADAGPMQSGD